MLKKVVIIISCVLLIGLLCFFIVMYDFAKGVEADVQKRKLNLDLSGHKKDTVYYNEAIIEDSLFTESIKDNLINLEEWKDYYENGNLKKKGLMTIGNHIYVGKWEYYSITGELDTIIDFDENYPISYFEAIEIAKENGFVMPGIDIELTEEKSRVYWRINKWLTNELGFNTAETILINTVTGSVTKPNYHIGKYSCN